LSNQLESQQQAALSGLFAHATLSPVALAFGQGCFYPDCLGTIIDDVPIRYYKLSLTVYELDSGCMDFFVVFKERATFFLNAIT